MMADGQIMQSSRAVFQKKFLTSGAFCFLQSSRQLTITSASRCEMTGAVQNPITIMKKILVIAALVVSAAGLKADDSHFFQASLTPDIALQPKTAEISGISLDLWGENPQHCFAFGFVNGSSGDSGGFTWSFIANYCRFLHRCGLVVRQYQQDKIRRLAGRHGQLRPGITVSNGSLRGMGSS